MLGPLLRASRMTEDARDVLHDKVEIFVSLLNIGVAISIIGGGGIFVYSCSHAVKIIDFKRN